jgi:hypothetical protein
MDHDGGRLTASFGANMHAGPSDLLALSKRHVQVVKYKVELSCVYFLLPKLNRKRRAERAYSHT